MVKNDPSLTDRVVRHLIKASKHVAVAMKYNPMLPKPDDGSTARYYAFHALGSPLFNSPEVIKALKDGLKDKDKLASSAAAKSLAEKGNADQETIDRLIVEFRDKTSYTRSRAITSLGEMLQGMDPVNEDIVSVILEAVTDSDRHVKMYGVMHLAGIPIDKDSPYREKVIEAALKASRDDHRFVRISSLVALRKWGPVDDRFFDRITDFLTDSAEMVRYNTVLSLEDFASGVKNPYPAFQKALNSDDPFVREAAAKILIQHLEEKVVVDESKKMDKDQQGRLRQLSKDLSSENPQTRQETIDFLIKIARPDIANLFVQLHDSNPNKTVWPRMVFKWIGDATAAGDPAYCKRFRNRRCYGTCFCG